MDVREGIANLSGRRNHGSAGSKSTPPQIAEAMRWTTEEWSPQPRPDRSITSAAASLERPAVFRRFDEPPRNEVVGGSHGRLGCNSSGNGVIAAELTQ